MFSTAPPDDLPEELTSLERDMNRILFFGGLNDLYEQETSYRQRREKYETEIDKMTSLSLSCKPYYSACERGDMKTIQHLIDKTV